MPEQKPYKKVRKEKIIFTKICLPFKNLMIVRPDTINLGHMAIEIQSAITLSKKENCVLYMITSKKAVNKDLFNVRAEGVTIIPSSKLLDPFFLMLKKIRDTFNFIFLEKPFYRQYMTDEAYLKFFDGYRRKLVNGYIKKQKTVKNPSILLKVAKKIAKKLGDFIDYENVRPYNPRELIANSPKIFLKPSLDKYAEEYVEEKFGIKKSDKYVVLHIREPGFKAGKEVHNKPNKENLRDDRTRNATVENFFPAIKELVAQGYKVVRVGDASMTPIKMDGVVDVATSNDLKPFVDLWLMYYCEFFVGTESGPPLIASLFRKRFIIVDVTCPIAIFPIDLNLQLLKRVRDLSTGKIMDPYEALDRRHLEFLRVTHKFEYIENTAEEILDGVKEFIALFKGEWKPSAEQIKYKNAVIETGIKNRDLKFLRKWGMQGEYLGEGHICSTYLENKNFINLDNKSNEKEVSIQ